MANSVDDDESSQSSNINALSEFNRLINKDDQPIVDDEWTSLNEGTTRNNLKGLIIQFGDAKF